MSEEEIDTIAAPITAPGTGAVSLVRVSGPLCASLLESLCADAERVLSQPRKLVYAAIRDSFSGPTAETLDQALIAYFPAPNSFTGEDCLEFNLHGSPYLLARLLENLSSLGARLARPGEFSERAFLNGQIDLSQAEAIADLVASETAAQAKVARQQLEGKLSSAISDLGEPLRDLLAEIEAYLDFPEEDIEPLSYQGWGEVLRAVGEKVGTYVDSYSVGRVCRDGANVVLAGVPNAGKSSLLNSLVGEDRAIVTAVPGTTRDSIEERMSIDGLYVKLWDTAGLYDEDSGERVADEVEKLGIERSWKRAEEADVVLFVFDVSADIAGQLRMFREVIALSNQTLVVLNKCDIKPNYIDDILKEIEVDSQEVSATEGIGVDELCKKLSALLLENVSEGASILVTTKRHLEALENAQSAINRGLNGLEQQIASELIALEIRAALGSLSDIIGVTSTEDVLGRIFSKFCIGK